MIRVYLVLLSALFLLTGCGKVSDSQESERLERTQIVELQIKAQRLEDQVKTLQTANEAMYKWVESIDSRQLTSINLTPGDAAYRTLKTDLGSILISLSDVQPYANGSQVKIAFGNTTSVSILRPKARFQWGKNSSEGYPDILNGKSRTISFDVKDAGILRAGQWTTITIQLDGVPPSDLDFIKISEVDWSSVVL